MSYSDHWVDISLEQINSDPDALFDRRSTLSVYPQAQTRKSFCQRIMAKKMALSCGGILVVVGISFATFLASTTGSPTLGMDMKIGSKGKQAEETCTTEACVVAAADIIKSLDETADPCEDFFQFSCGGWVASNVIPDSKSKWGKFYELREAVDQAVRTIVETPIEAEDAQAVKNMKNLYNGCLNVDAIEAQGYNKFVDMVYGDEFGGWPMIQTSWDGSVFSTEKVAGDNLRTWLSSTLISVYAYLDSFDTSRNVLYIDQTSLALPRDFYIDQDTYADYISAYKNYIVDIARVMTREIGSGVSDTALIQAADNIVAFETKLAIGVVPDSERRNATEMYNPMTYTELKNKYPIFWNDYFGRVFTDTDVVLEESETLITFIGAA
ncbi:hypothetical protein TCAL_09039 [Tigriopus californicus]|uniref:Peptidase M13 N-terminal domain-containing protein n=1 Tax=Tigriopus californicus TaxID=6832 RepID=A0A553PPP2_TIGCA|nr:hypothetical protein TCAL_09039 [Tigriopus californicus]